MGESVVVHDHSLECEAPKVAVKERDVHELAVAEDGRASLIEYAIDELYIDHMCSAFNEVHHDQAARRKSGDEVDVT